MKQIIGVVAVLVMFAYAGCKKAATINECYITSIKETNLATGTGAYAVYHYEYDSDWKVKRITLSNSNSSQIDTFTFTYFADSIMLDYMFMGSRQLIPRRIYPDGRIYNSYINYVYDVNGHLLSKSSSIINRIENYTWADGLFLQTTIYDSASTVTDEVGVAEYITSGKRGKIGSLPGLFDPLNPNGLPWNYISLAVTYPYVGIPPVNLIKSYRLTGTSNSTSVDDRCDYTYTLDDNQYIKTETRTFSGSMGIWRDEFTYSCQ